MCSFLQNNFKKSISMLELAITITIAGVLTGLSTYYGNKIYNNAKHNADDKKIKIIKKALQDYFTYNHRLPKPADYLLSRSDDNFGREKSTNIGDVSFDADIHSVENKLLYKLKNKNRYIPEDFVQVEYITSDFGQYINTDFIINSTFEIVMKFSIESTIGTGNNRWPALFGARLSNHSADGLVLCRVYDANDRLRLEIGNRNFFYVNFLYNTVYVLSLTKDKFELNDNVIFTPGIGTINGAQPLYLTSLNANGTSDNEFYSSYMKAKIYYTRIRQNNTIVRDFVPCCKASSFEPSTNKYSVCGLCDVHSKHVNNMVFYGNSGSGNFVHGEPVQIYVPELESENIKENMRYTMYRGIVPFKELKLNENDVVDMYGNYFTYYVPEIMTIENGKTPNIYDISNEFVKVGYRKKDNSWGDYSKYPCPSIRNGAPNTLCDASKNNLYGILFNDDKKQLTRLPYGFQEVEYIESTAGQRIVTSYIPNYSDEILIDMELTNLSKTSTLWCSRTGMYDNTLTSFFIHNNAGGIRFDYKTRQTLTYVRPAVNERFILKYKNGDLYYNDRNIFSGDKSNSLSGGSITLFASYNGTADINYSYEKLYNFYVKNNGIMKLELVPCYTTTSIQANQVSNGTVQHAGAVGLFDVVSQKFFPNLDSGSFIAGPDTKLTNQYLQIPYGIRVKDLNNANDLEENGAIAYVLVGNGMDGNTTCALQKKQNNTESPQEIANLNNITKNYQKYSAQNCLNVNENSAYGIIGRNNFGTFGKEWTFYKGGKTDFFDDNVEYETLERLVENSTI